MVLTCIKYMHLDRKTVNGAIPLHLNGDYFLLSLRFAMKKSISDVTYRWNNKLMAAYFISPFKHL